MMPEVGQVWRSIEKRERVRIGRVWSSEQFCGGGEFVRCHPVHGGKSWFSTVDAFVERFARALAPPADKPENAPDFVPQESKPESPNAKNLSAGVIPHD